MVLHGGGRGSMIRRFDLCCRLQVQDRDRAMED